MHWAKVDSFFRQTCNCIGKKIISFVVFGSVARGENRDDSNIDLLIVFTQSANQNDLEILQNIVNSQNKIGGPLLSVNVTKTEDFLSCLEDGDELSRSIAVEGHCLLQSAMFRAAKQMVHVDMC